MGYQNQYAGVAEQLPPDVEQVVGQEGQVPHIIGEPPPVIQEPDKRTSPPPVTGVVTTTTVPTTEEEVVVVEEEEEAETETETETIIPSYPVLRVNRYVGSSQEWQEVVRWDITANFVGDLHEISLVSNNDDKTRYYIVIGNIDQQMPTDRATQTPVSLPWRANTIPGGASIYIAVLSTDGTEITVDAMITGTERIPE